MHNSYKVLSKTIFNLSRASSMFRGCVIALQSLVHKQLSFFYSLQCFRPTVWRKSCSRIFKFSLLWWTFSCDSYRYFNLFWSPFLVVSMSIVYCRRIEQKLVSEGDQNVSDNQIRSISCDYRYIIVYIKVFCWEFILLLCFLYIILKVIDEPLYNY